MYVVLLERVVCSLCAVDRFMDPKQETPGSAESLSEQAVHPPMMLEEVSNVRRDPPRPTRQRRWSQQLSGEESIQLGRSHSLEQSHSV